MTDTDIASWFRGRYTTRKEAFNLVKEYAGTATVEAVAKKIAEEFNMTSIPVNFAQRGDMVVVGKGRTSILGIVSLLGTDLMFLSKKRIIRLPLSDATAAYRV